VNFTAGGVQVVDNGPGEQFFDLPAQPCFLGEEDQLKVVVLLELAYHA